MLETCFQTHMYHLRHVTTSKRDSAGEKALEIAEIICTSSRASDTEIGQQLATRVVDLLDAWHGASGESAALVWEFAVRRVLELLREGDAESLERDEGLMVSLTEGGYGVRTRGLGVQ